MDTTPYSNQILRDLVKFRFAVDYVEYVLTFQPCSFNRGSLSEKKLLFQQGMS